MQLNLSFCVWSSKMGSLSSMVAIVLSEISNVFAKADSAGVNPIQTIQKTILDHRHGNIVLYGVGREGLMLKAFAMRLFHLGLKSHCIGDMNMPPVGSGDLFIASAGPGSFSTVDALLGVARSAGAHVLVLTAQAHGTSAQLADSVAVIPAQTMADTSHLNTCIVNMTNSADTKCRDTDEAASASSILPMGSVYEGALFVLFELVVLQLCKEMAESATSMATRHTNME